MKQLITILSLLFCLSITSQNLPRYDSAINALRDTGRILTKNVLGISASVKVINSNIDTLKKEVKKVPVPTTCATCEPGILETTVSLMPVLLFIIFGFYFIRWLRREGFKLGDALSSDSPDILTTTKTETVKTGDGVPVTTTSETKEPNYAKSSSRVIAFLTGLSAVIIAISLITLYCYGYVTKSGPLPEIDSLWKIIAGLGIGVVPYVTKVINTSPK